MSGILLAAGPVSTRLTVKNLSSAFNLAVTKTKFMSAAKQLEAANLGRLVLLEDISRTAHIFVKRPPAEAHEIFLQRANQDLCTPTEYEQRYHANAPTTITDRMRESLVSRGIVPAGVFTMHKQPASGGSVPPAGVFPKQEPPTSVPHPQFSPRQQQQVSPQFSPQHVSPQFSPQEQPVSEQQLQQHMFLQSHLQQ